MSDVCSSDLATSYAASLDLLVEFVGSRAGDFEGELLQRFGYLAGLMESALSEVVVASPAGKRFLRKLMLRTALVDHGEIETLLENYERIATKSGFREGWVRGSNQALALELPQRVGLTARLGDHSIDRKSAETSKRWSERVVTGM